jgi:hypothetical protein
MLGSTTGTYENMTIFWKNNFKFEKIEILLVNPFFLADYNFFEDFIQNVHKHLAPNANPKEQITGPISFSEEYLSSDAGKIIKTHLISLIENIHYNGYFFAVDLLFKYGLSLNASNENNIPITNLFSLTRLSKTKKPFNEKLSLLTFQKFLQRVDYVLVVGSNANASTIFHYCESIEIAKAIVDYINKNQNNASDEELKVLEDRKKRNLSDKKPEIKRKKQNETVYEFLKRRTIKNSNPFDVLESKKYGLLKDEQYELKQYNQLQEYYESIINDYERQSKSKNKRENNVDNEAALRNQENDNEDDEQKTKKIKIISTPLNILQKEIFDYEKNIAKFEKEVQLLDQYAKDSTDSNRRLASMVWLQILGQSLDFWKYKNIYSIEFVGELKKELIRQKETAPKEVPTEFALQLFEYLPNGKYHPRIKSYETSTNLNDVYQEGFEIPEEGKLSGLVLMQLLSNYAIENDKKEETFIKRNKNIEIAKKFGLFEYDAFKRDSITLDDHFMCSFIVDLIFTTNYAFVKMAVKEIANYQIFSDVELEEIIDLKHLMSQQNFKVIKAFFPDKLPLNLFTELIFGGDNYSNVFILITKSRLSSYIDKNDFEMVDYLTKYRYESSVVKIIKSFIGEKQFNQLYKYPKRQDSIYSRLRTGDFMTIREDIKNFIQMSKKPMSLKIAKLLNKNIQLIWTEYLSPIRNNIFHVINNPDVMFMILSDPSLYQSKQFDSNFAFYSTDVNKILNNWSKFHYESFNARIPKAERKVIINNFVVILRFCTKSSDLEGVFENVIFNGNEDGVILEALYEYFKLNDESKRFIMVNALLNLDRFAILGKLIFVLHWFSH